MAIKRIINSTLKGLFVSAGIGLAIGTYDEVSTRIRCNAVGADAHARLGDDFEQSLRSAPEALFSEQAPNRSSEWRRTTNTLLRLQHESLEMYRRRMDIIHTNRIACLQSGLLTRATQEVRRAIGIPTMAIHVFRGGTEPYQIPAPAIIDREFDL